MFQQYYSEPFYEAWERFKGFLRTTFYSCVPDDQLQLIFYYGLNEDTRRLVDDGSMANGYPFLLRNEDDAYFFLEDMVSYNYHFYLSHYNAQKHHDLLENMEKMIEKMSNITREMREERLAFNLRLNLLTISLNDELVRELVCEDILLGEKPMEQQLEEKPSFPEEVKSSP